MASKEENRKLLEEKRREYMDGKITHDAYYLWLADLIGATYSMIPFKNERVLASTDPHLNDLPLGVWDSCHPQIRSLAFANGVPSWSMSNTVCVLKALARRRANESREKNLQGT